MIARAGNESIPAATVTLDDMGWDKRAVRGASELTLAFSADELRAVGQHVVDYAAEAVADEPDYFTSDPELPCPASPDLFVDDADELARYLGDGLWSHETMLALLRAGGGGVRDGARWLVQDFRGASRHGAEIVVTVGASPKR